MRWLIHHVSGGGRFENLALIRIPLRGLPEKVRGGLLVVDRWTFQVSSVRGPFFGDPLLRRLYPYSVVPLNDYLRQKSLRDVFQLPEVISFARVPLAGDHTVQYVKTRKVMDVLRRMAKK